MRIKKFMSVLLVMALMFSFCSFFVYAESVETIYSKDLNYEAYGFGSSADTITDTISKSTSTYSSKSCTVYRFPVSGSYDNRFLGLMYEDNFKAGHNYSLNLYLNSDLPSSTRFSIYFDYIDYSGTVIKEVTLFEYSGTTSDLSKWIEVDVKFSPDSSLISSSSKQQIVIMFDYSSQAMSYVRVSEIIELTDEDDNDSWFEKIIESITSLPERIGNAISEFFTMLKNYFLYFQHPVSLDEDGVVLDANGQPIYTNPFGSALESVKNTFDGWIEDIDTFISDMDESRINVSTYIEKGTSVINEVMSASPILTACIIFAAGFLVIRKVVGR